MKQERRRGSSRPKLLSYIAGAQSVKWSLRNGMETYAKAREREMGQRQAGSTRRGCNICQIHSEYIVDCLYIARV